MQRRSSGLLAASFGVLVTTGCAGADPFAFVDDGFDISSCSVPQRELFLGGPARDGIPALTNPQIVSASEVPVSLITDRVLGLEINGEARAYPLSVLWWHEIINDTLGGEPVVVSYCPLTGSGLAFDPRVGSNILNFGVSGVLFENNLVMFDRQSESLWSQLGVSGICGAARDQELARLPVVETAIWWWVDLHPNTTVVTQNTGHGRPYGLYPYGTYNSPTNDTLQFPSSPFSDARPPKELVLGVVDGDVAVAYPFNELALNGSTAVLNDTLNGRPIAIVNTSRGVMVRAFDRTVDGQELTLSVNEFQTPTLIDAETGSTWSVVGRAIAGPLTGKQLRPLEDAYALFWFAWSVFHPDTRLYNNPIGGLAPHR